MNDLIVLPMVKLRSDGRSWAVCAKVEREGRGPEFVMSQFIFNDYTGACIEARTWAKTIRENYSKNNGYADQWHLV